MSEDSMARHEQRLFGHLNDDDGYLVRWFVVVVLNRMFSNPAELTNGHETIKDVWNDAQGRSCLKVDVSATSERKAGVAAVQNIREALRGLDVDDIVKVMKPTQRSPEDVAKEMDLHD
jgi:hypothetical protein